MKKLLLLVASATLVVPVLAMAQSSFDGTWKGDLASSKLPEKPDVYLLKEGMYHCKTCAPPYAVKADGSDQKIKGHPYFDTDSITVVDARTITDTFKKAGKAVVTDRVTVSADGTTASFEFSDSSAGNGTPITGSGKMVRVEKGPPGSHAISGAWRTTKIDTMSDSGLVVTFKVDGGQLKMSNPLGQTYTAKLDGTDAPYVGDPGTSSVSVRSVDKNTIEESDKRAGKVISVARMSISADGKTMTVDWSDRLHGTTGTYVAHKQ